MSRFRELMFLYRALLAGEGYSARISERYLPQEGDVVELLASPDGLEVLLLMFRKREEFMEVVPVSRFWEFATPRDALIFLEGQPHIAQTDLSLDLPLAFLSRLPLVKLSALSEKELEKVRRVYRGEERGAGRMSGGVKREFKREEAKRYRGLFEAWVREEETRRSLSDIFLEFRELTPAAGEESPWGRVEGVRWFYNEEEETLVLIPREDLVGREGRIVLELEEGEVTLFSGRIPRRISLPLDREAYDYRLLERRLRVKDV